MATTLFTKIINGDIPSHKIYEDDFTFAFLDINPVSDGHTLVVPKTPVEFIWDLSSNEYEALMATVQKLGRQLKMKLGSTYVGIKVVGSDVPHAHVHLIPFDDPATMNATPDSSVAPDHEKLAALAQQIAAS